jgi:hypothetical protein
VRFAVRRPSIPEASPRSHGVPRRNVPGRIHVSVVDEAAVLGDRCEGDVPALRAVPRDPVRPHTWRYCPGPAEPHPSDLGYPNFAGLAAETSHMFGPDGYDTEPLISPGLSPRRPAGRVVRVVEGGHGSCKVPQRLLLRHLGACRQPSVRGPSCGELSTLLQVTGRARAAGMPVRVLLNCEVPHVPCVGAVVPQQGLLGGRGKQPIPGHTNTLAKTTDILREVKRRFLPGLKVGVPTPRTR